MSNNLYQQTYRSSHLRWQNITHNIIYNSVAKLTLTCQIGTYRPLNIKWDITVQNKVKMSFPQNCTE